jgi:hypothetical protein
MIRIAEPAMEGRMKQRLIRYRTKPESVDKNAELIADVFRQLAAERPGGVRYLSLRLDDDSFVHIVETEADDGASALPGLAAFSTFQNGIRERCAEPPVVKSVTIVGNYRMLSEP